MMIEVELYRYNGQGPSRIHVSLCSVDSCRASYIYFLFMTRFNGLDFYYRLHVWFRRLQNTLCSDIQRQAIRVF